MRMIKIFLPCLALSCLAAGCTLQEAKDTPSPAAPGSGMSAQTNATGASAPETKGSGEATSTSGSPSVASSPASTPPVEAGTMQAGGPGGVMPQGAPGPMAGVASAPLTKTPDLDKKVTDAEKSGDKKKIGAAYAERGTFRMNDDAAGAKVKYRAALDDYRKALAADPTNADAGMNKKLIEDIYKSMGRPIPGEEGKTSPAKP